MVESSDDSESVSKDQAWQFFIESAVELVMVVVLHHSRKDDNSSAFDKIETKVDDV